MSDLRKVRPGAPLRIPAGAYNAFVDAAAAHQGGRFDQRGGGGVGAMPSGMVLVRNDSGASQDRFAVLGVDVPIIDPEDNEQAFASHVALSCIVPDEDDHAGRFVVLSEPLADGKIGRAWASGVCVVKVDVQDDGHTSAEVAGGETGHLESTDGGAATILWKAGDSGEQWAVIRFAATASPVALVKVTGNAARGGCYTGRVWGAPTGSSIDVTTGNTLTESLLGTDPGADNCYVLNAAETGSHNLTSGNPVIKLFLARRHPLPAQDGKPVYVISGIDVQDCS